MRRERLHKAFTGVKNILCGKTLRAKEKNFHRLDMFTQP
jgi:hypothetical protein